MPSDTRLLAGNRRYVPKRAARRGRTANQRAGMPAGHGRRAGSGKRTRRPRATPARSAPETALSGARSSVTFREAKLLRAQPGVGRDEQAAAGEADHPVERVEVRLRQVGAVADRPERLTVRPRRVASAGDVPHRDDVVDAVEPVHDPVEATQPAGHVVPFHLRLGRAELRVDGDEVGVLRRAVLDFDGKLPCGRHKRDGKVAVDVRVHPREGELERRDPAPAARLEQRRPRVRLRAGPRLKGVERVEEQPREDDVEPLDEPGVVEHRPVEIDLHALRDREIEPREAADAVGARQRRGDRLHPGNDLRDSCRRLHRMTIALSARAGRATVPSLRPRQTAS